MSERVFPEFPRYTDGYDVAQKMEWRRATLVEALDHARGREIDREASLDDVTFFTDGTAVYVEYEPGWYPGEGQKVIAIGRLP